MDPRVPGDESSPTGGGSEAFTPEEIRKLLDETNPIDVTFDPSLLDKTVHPAHEETIGGRRAREIPAFVQTKPVQAPVQQTSILGSAWSFFNQTVSERKPSDTHKLPKLGGPPSIA